ncbi:MAG: hypothetical protein K2K23_09215 [Muribaculaceae bacterium]|nr:hypothetical protein [Muribaculaceae bacterium]MDE6633163.1 hypothetical protein [Muribaculaceae bacterium]
MYKVVFNRAKLLYV